MTIASQLFNNRRYRATRRSSDENQRENPEDGRRASRSRRSGHENTDRNGRRAGTSRRQHSHCVAGQSEPQTIRVDRSNGETAAGIHNIHGHETSRVNGIRTRRDELGQQLPCLVLQARARLAERFRDFHFADNRELVPAQAPTFHAHTSAERSSISDSIYVKAETAVDFSGSEFSGHVHVNHQTDHAQWIQNMNSKPLASHSRTFSGFQGEVFEGDVFGDSVSTAVPECSICLDRFLDGEKLIRLPCEHMFHHSCLQPWLQAHGVCPYCRATC